MGVSGMCVGGMAAAGAAIARATWISDQYGVQVV